MVGLPHPQKDGKRCVSKVIEKDLKTVMLLLFFKMFSMAKKRLQNIKAEFKSAIEF